MIYRLVVNAYIDPDPVRNAELLEAATINATIFEEVCMLPGRPTFAEMFAAANWSTAADDVNVIANSDVSFDETLRLAADHLHAGECWALSRDDLHRSDSQDAWVFRGPISIPQECDFPPGVPGCDNRLAYLLSRGGYRLSNPCHSVRVHHHHASGLRRYRKGVDVVRGPYLQIHPKQLTRKPVAQ